MRGLLSWFVVHLMPCFSLIDSKLTCWGLLDVHSPEGGPSTRPLDPVSDLGGQQGRAGLGHSVPEPMQLEPSSPATDQVSSPVSATPMEVSAAVIALMPP